MISANKDWDIDVARQQARHRQSGMVLKVIGQQGTNYSIQAVRSTLPVSCGDLDEGQRQALNAVITQRIQEGGALLVEALARPRRH